MKKNIRKRIIYFIWHSIIIVPCVCFIFLSDSLNNTTPTDTYCHSKTEISRTSVDTEQYGVKDKSCRLPRK
jgi:hypothetical protein